VGGQRGGLGEGGEVAQRKGERHRLLEVDECLVLLLRGGGGGGGGGLGDCTGAVESPNQTKNTKHNTQLPAHSMHPAAPCPLWCFAARSRWRCPRRRWW